MTPSRFALPVCLALAFASAACRSTTTSAPDRPRGSENAWATVNGREISRETVEKAYRREAPLQPKPSEEEATAGKLTLLGEFIVQELLLDKARELKIELPESELDTAYAAAKKNIPDEQFEKELTARQLTAADMRESLRRDLLSQKVMEREIISKIAVTDQDIQAFYEANRAQFNRPEDAFHVAQITVTPVKEPAGTNRSGSDATSPQEAQAKAVMLMERLKSGAPFADLAADYSEDGQSAPRGGDLGFLPISQLRQVPAPLRDAVLSSAPGSVRLVSIGGGHTIVLVVAKDLAGQKDPSMPEVRQAITQTLRGRKEQLLRAAYVNALRNDAVIVNHLADRLVEAHSKLPSTPSIAPAAPAAPGAK
jgi:parvulin-like peptidyl-prolyl isomerase